MAKNWYRIGAALLAVTAGSAGLAGCEIDENPSLLLVGFHGLAVDDGGCVHRELASVGGTFDAAASVLGGGPFTVYARIENPMPSNADEEAGRTNTTIVFLNEVEVRYRNEGVWSFLPAKATFLTTGTVDSSSELYLPIMPIDANHARKMLEGGAGAPSPIEDAGECADLVLTVRVKGRMGDGSAIETNWLDYPVTVCNQAIAGCAESMVPSGCSFSQPDGFECVTPD